jgi:hypothetical protein
MRIEGGCHCGACRYASDAEPLNVRACHCRSCQKVTGGPVYARVQVPLDSVTIVGPVGWYRSSPPLRRGFCTVCGASLFSERQDLGAIGLTMGTLDAPDRFRPSVQIWASARQDWLATDDTIPCFAEFPPA